MNSEESERETQSNAAVLVIDSLLLIPEGQPWVEVHSEAAGGAARARERPAPEARRAICGGVFKNPIEQRSWPRQF